MSKKRCRPDARLALRAIGNSPIPSVLACALSAPFPYTEAMLRSEAARYARWSAAIAVLLASVTAFVYLKRGWTSHIERKNAPPSAPVDVSRQSAGISFKKFDEQNRIIFTVDASKS